MKLVDLFRFVFACVYFILTAMFVMAAFWLYLPYSVIFKTLFSIGFIVVTYDVFHTYVYTRFILLRES